MSEILMNETPGNRAFGSLVLWCIRGVLPTAAVLAHSDAAPGAVYTQD